MQVQPLDLSTISVKFGDQHTNLTQVFSFSTHINKQKTQKNRKQLEEILGKKLDLNCLIWRIKTNTDAKELQKLFYHQIIRQDKTIQDGTLTTIRKGDYVYLIKSFIKNEFQQSQQCPEQIQLSFNGSIKVDQSSLQGDNYSFFTNSLIQLQFKKTEQTWSIAQGILSQFGISNLSDFDNLFDMLKVLNLKLNFNSMKNLPADSLKYLTEHFNHNKTKFDYNQMDENVRMNLIRVKYISSQGIMHQLILAQTTNTLLNQLEFLKPLPPIKQNIDHKKRIKYLQQCQIIFIVIN